MPPLSLAECATTLCLSIQMVGPVTGQEMHHQIDSGQIIVDGRKAEELSKPELLCALYRTWYYSTQMMCYQMKRDYKEEPKADWCGEDLKPKAEACNLTQ